MNATVNRLQLTDAAKLASATADPKSPQDLLAHALIRFTSTGLAVVATDLTTSITSELADEKRTQQSAVGSVCVDARRFAAAVASLPSAEVSVSLDDKLKVTLKSGKATVSLAGRKGEDFPKIQVMPDGFEVPAAALAAAVKRAKYAFSADADRFPGVYLNVRGGICQLVAVDGHRMAIVEFGAPKANDIDEVTVPAEGLIQMAAALDGMESAQIAVSGGRLFVRAGSVVVSAKLADRRPVPWGQLVTMAQEKKRHVIRVDRETLMYAARRAGMMTGGDTNLANGIDLTLADELTVASALGGVGDATTSMAIEGAKKPVEVRMSWRYLADALGSLDGDVVEFDYADGLSEVLLRAPGSKELHMIAPQSPPARSAK